MKPHSVFLSSTRLLPRTGGRGFALVVTLSLMILLTLIAVGLLSLSAVQLRSSAQGQAMATAQANARMALLLALGEIQKSLGPDGRVTVPAEQRLAEEPAAGTPAHPHRHWTGVYEAWQAEDGFTTRPQPKFVQWLASSPAPENHLQENAAETKAAGEIPMVTVGPAGADTPDQVTVPTLPLRAGTSGGKLAWWVVDESMKAHVTAGTARSGVAAAPAAEALFGANAAICPNTAAFAQLGEIKISDPTRDRYLTNEQLALRNPRAGALFHDLTTTSRGLPVDVTRGRFKFDFSALAMQDRTQLANLPLYKADGTANRFTVATDGRLRNNDAFTQFDGGLWQMFGNLQDQPGIHMEELWLHANIYRKLQWNGGIPQWSVGSGAEKPINDPVHQVFADPWLNYTKPVLPAVQFVFSFLAREYTDPVDKKKKYNMALTIDVLAKVWNPNNVKVTIPQGAPYKVTIPQLPFRVQWEILDAGGTARTLAQSDYGENTYAFSLAHGSKPGKPENAILSNNGMWKSSTKGGKAFFGNPQLAWFEGYVGGIKQPEAFSLDPGECKIFGYGENELAKGSIQVDLRPGWAPGTADHRRGYVDPFVPGGNNGGFGAIGLALDDSVEFRVVPDDVLVAGNGGARTNCGKGIGTDLRLGESTLHKSHFGFPAQPDPKYFPEIRSSQRLRVSDYLEPKPFMILGVYMNAEQSSPGITDSVPNPSRLLTNAAVANRLFEKEEHTITYLQEIWRCDPMPLAYDSTRIDINSKDQGYFGGGHSVTHGVPRCAVRQLDAAPPLSLMSLSHAIANGYAERYGQWDERVKLNVPWLHKSSGYFKPDDIAFSTVTYAAPQGARLIGNSFASPLITADKVTGTGPYHVATTNVTPMFDHSYLSNATLFDSWFCSSLHDGGLIPSGAPYADTRPAAVVLREFLEQAAAAPEKRLFNPRVIPAGDPARAREKLLVGSSLHPEIVARLGAHVLLDGAFNINSTRKEAWRALLSSARDQAKLLNGSPISTTDKTPVGSSGLVATSAATPAAAPNEMAQWGGFRTLDDKQIEELAGRIVREVRDRGPFLSLADFLNRRPAGTGDQAKLGAMQAAIESAGLNDALKGANRSVVPDNFKGLPNPGLAAISTGLSRSAGIPGFVMQSDVLAPVANQLAPRGDTFRIRGYGSATDANGRVLAQAWCEAIVQRVPEYVDGTDEPETAREDLKSEVNRTFGRRFQIVSFQWLPREAA